MNLEIIKKKFKMLVYTDYTKNAEFPFIVYHPFVNNTHVFFDGKIQNIEDINVWNKFQKYLIYLIEQCDNLDELILMINKPYLPTVFKIIEKNLDYFSYNKLLRLVYTYCEFPNHDTNVTFQDWKKYFKKSSKQYLMNESELNVLNSMTEKIMIYRGTDLKYKYYNAFSWTLNKDKAIWYATRFGSEGKIYMLEIPKDLVIAYFEIDDEIIFDPQKFKKEIKSEIIR